MPTPVEVPLADRDRRLITENLRQWLTTAPPFGRGLSPEDAATALEGAALSCSAVRDQHLLVVRALLRDTPAAPALTVEAELHSQVDYRVVKGDKAEEATRFTWPWHAAEASAK